ncbi:MAG TPA: RNase J family beta-CASP ribonuclease, partial [Oceanithermus profundus]|nr:RNase J family beta-CASP ribonuclease [Oceanithermus profundus]
PKFFVPWHGEGRHQTNFRWLVEKMPKPPVKTIVPENGDVLVLTGDDLKKTGRVKAGALYVDGLGVGDITDDILEERQAMAADGIVILTALVSERPVVEVVSRGFVKAGQRLHSEIRRMATEAIQKGVREKKPLEQIRDDVYYPAKKFIRKATGRDPILIPILFEA